MASTEMEAIINKFKDFTEKPVKFLGVQKELTDDIKNFVKIIYDFTKSQESAENREALPELIVEDFDEEQIWQEIELQNSECWNQLVWEVANCMSVKSDLVFPINTSEDKKEEISDVDDINSAIDDENSATDEKSISDNDIVIAKKKKVVASKIKSKPSIVDDKFFKLQEMEQFLLKEEKKEGQNNKAGSDSDEESIDMFDEIDDDDDDDVKGEKDVMYSDFFDQNGEEDVNEEMQENCSDYFNHNKQIDETESMKKRDKNVTFAQDFALDEDSSQDSVDNEIVTNKIETDEQKKSEFELRQQRLKQQIDRLEERTLKEAPWQLKGEVDALKRPQNSLLQEVVDFDLTSRPAPIITEETTTTLEDIIKQRIKDKAWDDVVKKEKPVDDQLVFRKKEVLDQSKSKQSLAQVYEAEYLKQKQALSGETEEEKEPESHVEIRDTMLKLFAKLDALCHYHYTPRAAQAEVKIVTNTPAISMEEVAPVATSDAALLAPEEVKRKSKGDLMSKEERTKTDKNRERRKKKKMQREKGQVMKVTEHRNTKKGVEVNDNKTLKTSKAFFQQLNDNSTSLIKSNKNKRNVKNKGQ